MNALSVLLDTADVNYGAGEDNVHIVLFGCGIGSLCKLQDLVTVQVGLGADLKERCFDIGHNEDSFQHGFPITYYSNCYTIRQLDFLPLP